MLDNGFLHGRNLGLHPSNAVLKASVLLTRISQEDCAHCAAWDDFHALAFQEQEQGACFPQNH